MNPLAYDELSFDEKIFLGSLSKHPGFIVLKRLMESACKQATENLVKLNPEDERYNEKLKARQMAARITNDVCASLLKSIIMHSESAQIEEASKKAQEEIEKEVEEFGIGSFKRKIGQNQL